MGVSEVDCLPARASLAPLFVLVIFLTAKRLYSKAQGKRSATLGTSRTTDSPHTPKAFYKGGAFHL